MRILLDLIYPALIVSSLYNLLKDDDIKQTIINNRYSIGIFSITLIIFLNLFVIIYMRNEHTIYYWDFSGFWRRAIELNQLLSNNLSHAINTLIRSMLYEEYSYLPQLFLSSHIAIVGDTYPRFIMATVNYGIIPSMILLYVYVHHLFKHNKTSKSFFICVAILLILFTGNLLPLMLGYVGSIGLYFIVYIMFLNEKRELTFIDNLLIGLFLVIIILLRRWYVYFVIAYFIIGFIVDIFSIGLKNHSRVIIMFKNYLIQGLFACMILAVFFFPLIKTFISYDYSFAYQSAKVGGYDFAIEWFRDYFGLILIFPLLIGIVIGYANDRLRRLTLFSLFSIIFIIVLFYRIQVFGSHHYYIINVFVVLLCIFGFSIIDIIKLPKIIKFAFPLLFLFLYSMNFLLLFTPQIDTPFNHFVNQFKGISTVLNAPPRRRNDVDIIKDMTLYLKDNAGTHEYVYVLAGSSVFSDDILRNALLPEVINPIPSIESTKQLDTRDGIPQAFFEYTYIVVTDPVQFHNGEEYQKVIGYLANGILNDVELKPYYYLEKDYAIDQGIKVFIYRRIEDIPQSLREKYRSLFKQAYPDYPFLYAFD